MPFRVGVMILATILVAVILFLFFRRSTSLLGGTYTINITFAKAPGVTAGTPVRKLGIRIGQVQSVQFANGDAGVIVTAQIDADRRLNNDEQCRVANSLLMGDAVLEIVKNPDFRGAEAPLKPGETCLARWDRT